MAIAGSDGPFLFMKFAVYEEKYYMYIFFFPRYMLYSNEYILSTVFGNEAQSRTLTPLRAVAMHTYRGH